MSKITCVGCGMMGSNIVESLMNHNHEVDIVDVDYSKALKYVQKGAKYYKNISEALDSKFIILSLPNDKIVNKVFEHSYQLTGKIIVNTTSEVPSETVQMKNYFESLGAKYLDATILTYQGEVGTKHSCLLYSGDKNVFNSIEEELTCLSKPAIYVGEPIVGAEIIDLISITAHFGITYTPLEYLCKLENYDISIDKYFNYLDKALNAVVKTIPSISEFSSLNNDEFISKSKELLSNQRIDEKLNKKWLNSCNRSLKNHYQKILKIYHSDYEY